MASIRLLLAAALLPMICFCQTPLTTERVQALLKPSGVKAPRSAVATETTVIKGSRELLLSWTPPVNPPSYPIPRTAVDRAALISVPQLLSQHNWAEDAPRQRDPQLSEELILVVGLDTDGTLRSWTLINDPRILRTEAPTPSGQLGGQVLQRQAVEFNVVLPADPAIITLRLYKPLWDGKEFQLDLLTETVLQ